MSVFTGQLKKVEGKMVHGTVAIEAEFKEFIKQLQDGDKVEVYMEKMTDDGNLAQLAKIHALIRHLSQHIGENIATVKLLVKEEAGLCFAHTAQGKEFLVCKSFGDCSKVELSSAIEACISIGRKVNLNLY